ncbi:4159_t:CDS:10, partial [Acaulospora colombiana]
EHLDLRYAKQHGIPIKGLLANRIPDLIKMAFTSSAAYVTEIRLSGLLVLKDVVEIFSSSPDPDYDDALLLEQHQAPITAALTPAFSSDSTPELLAFAVQVCAIFVGSGVIKDVSKMGRILKLLTGALDQSKTSGSFAIGEVQQMSPNAAVMLKISTLTAWAELQIASIHQNYLKAVILPYQETLASLWVGALRDYASIRGDTEVLQEATSSAVDTLYLNLGKEVLLPILKATSVMMESRSPFIVAAMDGREGESPPSSFRSEPAALFFVIFGLVFEALTQSSGSNSSTSGESVTIMALESLEHLVRPEYAGNAILEASIFDEFSSLCYRLAMMETANVHIPLIRTITSLASTQLGHANKRAAYPLSPDMCVHSSPGLTLVQWWYICWAHFTVQRAGAIWVPSQSHFIQVHGYIILLLALSNENSIELLKDEAMQYDLVGPTLPALKKILATAIMSQDKSDSSRLIQGLISCCLQNIEETSNRSGISVDLKAKNNMFAVVLVLTCLPPDFTLSRALVDECCYLISQRINDDSELVATAATNVDDSTKLSSLSPPLDEALKTFTAFFTGIPEHGKSAALAVILPTLALLLDPSRSPPSSLHIQTVPILLSFATSAPGPFKEITDKLDPAPQNLRYPSRHSNLWALDEKVGLGTGSGSCSHAKANAEEVLYSPDGLVKIADVPLDASILAGDLRPFILGYKGQALRLPECIVKLQLASVRSKPIFKASNSLGHPGGKVGQLVVQALVAANFSVTALARPTSSYTAPPNLDAVKVVKVASDDHAKLVEAFKDQDAIVLTIDGHQNVLDASKVYVDAAIEAGPQFAMAYSGKAAVGNYLAEKAKEGKINYITIKAALDMAFMIDTKSRKATLYDTGEQKFHSTTLPSIGKAVAGVLSSPSEYLNKDVYIHDFYTTQAEILNIVQSEVGETFETQSVDMTAMGEQSIAGLKKGDYSPPTFYGLVKSAAWGKEGAADWDPKDSSAALGLGQLDLKEEVKKLLGNQY